jgi:hypothetical protein
MKTLLAILLSFIVSEAPVLAIHGGYTLGGAATAIGTYAGVLIPVSDTVLTTGTSTSDFGSNALGLFTLSVPAAGLGSGTVYIFSGAQQLVGTLQGLPDPDNVGGIVGIITATGQIAVDTVNDNIFGFGVAQTETQVTGQASGAFSAAVSSATVSESPTGVNLDGTANVTIQTTTTGSNGNTVFIPTDQIVFEVDGFQQSPTATASTTTAAQ